MPELEPPSLAEIRAARERLVGVAIRTPLLRLDLEGLRVRRGDVGALGTGRSWEAGLRRLRPTMDPAELALILKGGVPSNGT